PITYIFSTLSLPVALPISELVFRGVAAHSARPWLGRNAIHQAIRGLRPLVELEPNQVILGGLAFREVLSVTEIHGGVANNVIPEDRKSTRLNSSHQIISYA